MKATVNFSVTIEGKDFVDLQKRIRALTSLLKENNIRYSINSEAVT